MRLRTDQWDARRRKVVNHPRHATLNIVAAALIAAHRGRKHLVDLLERYKSVHVVTGCGNRVLKEIAEELGLPPLTFYTARYTWATIALSQGVAIEVISQALGHTYGMAVTGNNLNYEKNITTYYYLKPIHSFVSYV